MSEVTLQPDVYVWTCKTHSKYEKYISHQLTGVRRPLKSKKKRIIKKHYERRIPFESHVPRCSCCRKLYKITDVSEYRADGSVRPIQMVTVESPIGPNPPIYINSPEEFQKAFGN